MIVGILGKIKKVNINIQILNKIIYKKYLNNLNLIILHIKKTIFKNNVEKIKKENPVAR